MRHCLWPPVDTTRHPISTEAASRFQRVRLQRRQRRLHLGKRDAVGLLIKVGVAFDLEPRGTEDRLVVAPRRSGEQDLRRTAVLFEELSSETDRARSLW